METLTPVFGQQQYAVRFDWGPMGALVTGADVAVVVDVLSFSTSVCIAVERGMSVFPYLWQDARAEIFAREHDAVLAVGRLEATKPGAVSAPSLSPAGLLKCGFVERLVLPSPNGSTISAALYDAGSTVVAGCLRNAWAVAEGLVPVLDRGDSVAIIAAGERWEHDNSLRPALEDQLGAGAILSAMKQLGYRHSMSPEASTTADLFDAGREHLSENIHECVGAYELASTGFRADVDAAAALDSSHVVPILEHDAFKPSFSA